MPYATYFNICFQAFFHRLTGSIRWRIRHAIAEQIAEQKHAIKAFYQMVKSSRFQHSPYDTVICIWFYMYVEFCCTQRIHNNSVVLGEMKTTWNSDQIAVFACTNRESNMKTNIFFPCSNLIKLRIDYFEFALSTTFFSHSVREKYEELQEINFVREI